VSVILPRDLAERLRDALTEATGRG
jgi:hypothetical protein